MESRRVEIWFGSDGQHLSVRIAGGDQENAYTANAQGAQELPSLPEAINSDTPVEQTARQYQEFFRGLRTASGLGPNAMEQIFLHIGDQTSGTVDLRFVPSDECLWAGGHPWELLLHDSQRDQLQDRLVRVAAVRSTGATNHYSPRRIDGKLRVLLLQGADGPQPLDFAGERSAIETAWKALGPILQAYVDEPIVRPALGNRIASDVAEVRPHLLWFSGHGRSSDNGFELLIQPGGQGDWMPATRLRDALLEAGMTGALPIIVAFWACEAGRAPRPSLNAGEKSFPTLVRLIVDAGVEAVIGVQTKIYDTSACVMGNELFRSLAEGLGPAQSLASARAKLLAMPRTRAAPGRGSEWTSPVMWVNGANLPVIEWGRPIDADEALAFHRLGTESLLVFEGGQDVLQEAPDSTAASTAAAWVNGAPMWVNCPDLHLIDQRLEVIRRLRNLVTSENKTVLVFHFRSVRHSIVLDAVCDGFRDIERRSYPKPRNEAGDFLASLFEAFRGGENQRRKAWIELLKRQDMIVAIIAEGGLPPSDELRDAKLAAAALLVFSNRLPEDPEGSATFWDGWQADGFDGDGTVPMANNEALTAFLTAFAMLDKPLSENAVAELARDFDLDFDRMPRDEYLARFGQRYVVEASVAQKAIESLSASETRAAHRACAGLLARVRDEFDAPRSRQLVWRVHHYLQAEELEDALKLASRAIKLLAAEANHVAVVQLFQSLRAARRQLAASGCMDVAAALIHTGNPKRAYDLLRQIPSISACPVVDRLRFGVLKAEALRNLPVDDSRKESIAALEAIINDTTGSSLTTKDAKRWMLIAEHDLARNIHYFQHDTLRACEIFRRVISNCGTDPDLAYLKSAALRNLADALDKYTYDKLQRDPDSAEQCLRDAAEIARRFPSAKSLLPEMLYKLAQYEYAKRPGDAGTDIRRAIDLAREYGIGLVLTIAKDKLFWWQVGPLRSDSPPSAFDFREWTRLENELDLLIGHAWPLRTLIDSRLRAGKCLDLLGRSVNAAEVLGRAGSLLKESRILDHEGDWIHRWQPVFAGLAVLSQPASGGARASETEMWADLLAATSEAGLHKESPEKTVKQVWEELH